MKALYLVNMDEGNFGGLFKATYERLKRHQNEQRIVNINYYDSPIIAQVKEKVFRKVPLKKPKDNYQYKERTIHNLNAVRGITYYKNKILKNEKEILDTIFERFLKKNTQDLTTFDMIHAHWGYPNGYLAYQLAQKYQLPYFITFHGSDLNNIQKHQKEYLLKAMENAAKCFFVSQQLLENAKEIGYSGKNALITYNGVDPNVFQPVEKSQQEDEKRVGYIGALEKVKGADLLVELYAKIQEKHPTVSLMIIGDGSLKETLVTESRSKQLMVEFVPQVPFDSIPKYLGQIDVLVMPSRNEGLGMIILEAHAMGVPVVATKVGGIPEAIGNEADLVDMDQQLIENMANRVSQILTNKAIDVREYRDRIATDFSWETIVALEESVYSDYISDRDIDTRATVDNRIKNERNNYID